MHMTRQDYTAAVKEAVLPSNRNVAATDQSDSEQLNIGAQALRMTSIHAQFGNIEEGMSSVEEAIRLGLRDNNPLLLEHCLAWFHHLQPFQASDVSSVLKRFISTAEELKEPLLAGWGRLEESKALLSSGAEPAKVLLSLLSSLSSDSLPVYCPPSDKVAHLSAVFVTMATAWEQYGFSHVSQMYCQLIGHMMSHDPLPSEKERESFVLSLSVLVRYMLHSGDYKLALVIIKTAKHHLLPHNRSFKLLCRCEEEVGFDWSIQNGDITTAREHLVRLQSLDKDSALIRSITLKAAQGNHLDCLTAAHQLLSSSSTSPCLKTRALLLLAELHSSSGSPSLSLPLLSACLSLSHTHHISPYPTKLLLAQIHLQMGSPVMCEILSRECLLHFHANSHAVNRAISQLLLDQASLYIKSQHSGHLEKKDGLAVIPSLKRAVFELERCQATKHLRRATVLLTSIYNLVGYHAQRDKMAKILIPTCAAQRTVSDT